MSLIERIGTPGEARVWHGDMPLESEYTVGIAGERFLRAIKDQGVFLGTVCPVCELTYVPPTMYCERCFAQLDQWIELGTRGSVYTYTILTRNLADEAMAQPEVLALIRFDGAHGGIVHRLGEVDPAEVEIDMTVEAVLKPKKDREGSILDVKYFKPI